ncbi:MAG TPA: hypothetical protein EYP41_14800 [Anaerolineae bacterium]|nr:hypothetical protein [Anaerolineae bacterium]
MAISSLADVKAIEQIILEGHGIPANTYEALQLGAGINPHRIALRFFYRARLIMTRSFIPMKICFT